MNLIIAALVIIGGFKTPKIFYLEGKDLTELNSIFLPNVRAESFQFFVNSPVELEFSSIDSSSVPMCLVARTIKNELRLKGRWYSINCVMPLKTGSESHMISLFSRSGAVFKKKFTVNVEGTQKVGKQRGVIK